MRVCPVEVGSPETGRGLLKPAAAPVENNRIELYNLITLLKLGLLAPEADFRKTYVTAGKPRATKNSEQLRTCSATS